MNLDYLSYMDSYTLQHPNQKNTAGGGRALGGDVGPGRDYVVGENGPEILRMGSNRGTIIPTGRARSQPYQPASSMITIQQPIVLNIGGYQAGTAMMKIMVDPMQHQARRSILRR